MRRLLVAAAAFCALAAAPLAARAQEHGAAGAAGSGGAMSPEVGIGFDAFAPPRVDVITGDTVDWHNNSIRVHTVTAEDQTWSSTRLAGGEMFTHRFTAGGSYPYYCQIHPFMRGEVDVHDLLLTAPRLAAAPNRAFPLAGRAALEPGSPVAIEAQGEGGFAPVATATVGHDGSFVASITPRTTTTYRAVAGEATSPPVVLSVLDHHVGVVAARGARRVVLSAHVTPAAPGETVVLQLRLRDRFGWWPVQHARLDRASRARFVVPLRRAVNARVLLTLPDGATPLATRTLRIAPRR